MQIPTETISRCPNPLLTPACPSCDAWTTQLPRPPIQRLAILLQMAPPATVPPAESTLLSHPLCTSGSIRSALHFHLNRVVPYLQWSVVRSAAGAHRIPVHRHRYTLRRVRYRRGQRNAAHRVIYLVFITRHLTSKRRTERPIRYCQTGERVHRPRRHSDWNGTAGIGRHERPVHAAFRVGHDHIVIRGTYRRGRWNLKLFIAPGIADRFHTRSEPEVLFLRFPSSCSAL